jgi:hypothetical protein
MAVAMPKVDPLRAAVVALVLADLAMGYPLYEKYSEDPLASLPAVAAPAPGGVQLQGDADDDSGAIRTGQPPSRLYSWDPFQPPKGVGTQTDPTVETTVAAPEQQSVPIPVDEIRLYGIISLNGQYRALMGAVGTAAEEVRRGMLVPGSEDIRVVEIHRDRVILSKPGSINTPILMNQPGLIGQPWFQSQDSAELRGRIRMER